MQNKFQVVVPNIQSSELNRSVLYLSDLPFNVTESDIRLFFDEFSNYIAMITINAGSKYTDFSNGKSLNARIIFKESNVANTARRAKNMNKIKGKTIRVMWDERDNQLRYNNQTNIFVKNIPFEVKPREFYELFLQYGDICSAKVPEDEEGNHLGYGYINYYDSESADRSIKATNEKEIWGSILEVKYFQKKNERLDNYSLSNSSLYIKNFPLNYKENDLIYLCSEFGDIVSCKIIPDEFNRRFAIITYSNEESCLRAKNALNGKMLSTDSILFVDSLMNKQERKKVLNTRIMDTNYKLNELFKNCNLHIRNIPYHATEKDLEDTFKAFGELKSVKIQKYMLVTKVNNELKEIPTSKGFGYVCFEEPEAAKAALEAMDGKFLPKYETWKRPLLIEYFMPKNERTPFVVNKINQISNPNPRAPMMGMNPMMNQGYLMNQNIPPMMNQMNTKFNPRIQNMMNPAVLGMNQGPLIPQQNKKKPQTSKKSPGVNETSESEIDYNYLKSLDSDSKRDYLGEQIFKKIENHRLSQSNNLTIDTIGKITGMILGIEDISEIIDIYENNDNLTSRMTEALELINQKN